MWVHIRQHKRRYHIYEGFKSKQSDNPKSLGNGLTRRQAMRIAKSLGHRVYVRGTEVKKMEDILKIRLTNLDDYESRANTGVWINLPATADELANVLDRIGAIGGVHGGDYFITDFESSLPVLNSQPVEYIQRMNIDDLNNIAGQIALTPAEELQKVNASMELLVKDDGVRQMLESRRNTQAIQFLPDVLNHEQLGLYMVNHGIIDVADEFRDALNYEQIGRTAAKRDNGAFTVDGYVFVTDNPWEREDRIPDEFRIEELAMNTFRAVRAVEPGRMYDSTNPISNVRTNIPDRKKVSGTGLLLGNNYIRSGGEWTESDKLYLYENGILDEYFAGCDFVATGFKGFENLDEMYRDMEEIASDYGLEYEEIVYDDENLEFDNCIEGTFSNISRAVGEFSGTNKIKDWLDNNMFLEISGKPGSDINMHLTLKSSNFHEYKHVIDVLQEKIDSRYLEPKRELVSAVREADPGHIYDKSPEVGRNLKASNKDAVQRSVNRAVAADSKQGKRAKPERAYPSDDNTTVNYKRDEHKKTLRMLENGIKDVFKSDKYKTYLDTLSKFHNYSYGNCVLIAKQLPEAVNVAGVDFWYKVMGRKPRENVNRIKIIAPVKDKVFRDFEKIDKDGKKQIIKTEVIIPEYKTVEVLDVSQTYGRPVPRLYNALSGKVDQYEELFEALERISPVPIHFESTKGRAKGYYDQDAKIIVINDGMSEIQNIKTAVHEIAHARLHDINNTIEDESKRPDIKTQEIEAESIAYAVCQNYGIDTSEYSFGYIAEWSQNKDLPELKASLGVVRNEVNDIVVQTNMKLREIRKEHDKALAAKVDAEIEKKMEIKRAALEKEEVIQEILTEIRRTEPDFNNKVLTVMENDLREMTLEEIKANEYTNYYLEKDVSQTLPIEQTKNIEKQQETKQKSNDSPAAAQKKPNTRKKTAPAKKGVLAELAAAKEEVARRKPATKTKVKTAEVAL